MQPAADGNFPNFSGVPGNRPDRFGAVPFDFPTLVNALPSLFLFLFVFNVGDRSVWHAMIIGNVGASILGFLLYQFVDFKMRKKTELLVWKNLQVINYYGNQSYRVI